MNEVYERIRDEILSWPSVMIEQHRFRGKEFRVREREMGHIHGDHLADLPFPMKTRNELVNSGRESPHHMLPQSGWISYWITNGEIDIPAVVDLFRNRYDQLRPKNLLKRNKNKNRMP